MPPLRIATRTSVLALCQAELVRQCLLAAHPGLSAELLPITASGDRASMPSSAAAGGKGLFTKELELALQEGQASFAVHSLKDVPSVLPPGFAIAAVLERADARDALVSREQVGFAELPDGARVASSSLRRQCQLLAARPALCWQPIRGNVHTRLEQLERGVCDALVLAAAGLQRAQLTEHIAEYIEPALCLPAAGQGALAIEIRADDERAREWAAPLHHHATGACTAAERSLCRCLGADCNAPLGAYAECTPEGGLRLRAAVGSADGQHLLRAEQHGPIEEPEKLGLALARELLAKGAEDFFGIGGKQTEITQL